MKHKYALVVCVVLCLFFVYVVKTAKASDTNTQSDLIETRTLPDGVIERIYANGTVRHDFTVNSEIQMHVSLSTTTTMITATPLFPIDHPDPELIDWILLFVCLSGAGENLRKISKAYPKPKPTQLPLLKFTQVSRFDLYRYTCPRPKSACASVAWGGGRI